jgi:protein-tyrosine phosphatase
MFASVLVICVGNICRSPLGERVLAAGLPGLRISSAGLAAVVGEGADPSAALVAQEIGVDLGGHVARQLTADIGASHDLLLVMEPGHRAEIFRRFPSLSGRVMLFDQWTGGQGIPDPYGKPLDLHRKTRDRIVAAAAPWIARLRR